MKANVKALDRLLIYVIVEQTNTEIHPQALLDVIQTCNRNKVDAAHKDESTNPLIQKYVGFQKQVCKGNLGKTARFWVSFMDNGKEVFMLIYAAKTNNMKIAL